MLRADFFDFELERRRNFTRLFVGDDRNPFVRFQAQAIADGVSRSRLKFRINRYGVGAVGHG
jgi:hypothetical protein